jgi:endonuclease-3
VANREGIKVAAYNKIVEEIKKVYLSPHCELNYSNNYELIVAVILSAQCTDKRVNMVTPALIEKYPTVFDLATAKTEDVEAIIMPCGFYHSKAKNLIGMAQGVVANFGGEIPSTKADLRSLAGVGEKTANVVLAEGFKIPAIAVDTHVFRVSNRLGLADAKDVQTTQAQLEQRVDKADWINLHYSLVLHNFYPNFAEKCAKMSNKI